MHYPEKKGYSARNLAYMCQFARTFSVEVLQKMLSCYVKLKKPTIDNVQSATRILDNLQFVQEVPAQIKEIGRPYPSCYKRPLAKYTTPLYITRM